MTLYLASKSPRRRELLTQIGIDYTVVDAVVDETPQPGEPAAALVERLARAKAAAGLAAIASAADAVVVGADTVVVLGDEALGKPRDRDEAATMLRRLSGDEHVVMSGLAVATGETVRSVRCDTTVRFSHLTDAMIDTFLASGEADDKAGAYGIQGRAGAFVTHIEGSYSSVVGLPLHLLAQLLDGRLGQTVGR